MTNLGPFVPAVAPQGFSVQFCGIFPCDLLPDEHSPECVLLNLPARHLASDDSISGAARLYATLKEP